jgi:hypothetical protein
MEKRKPADGGVALLRARILVETNAECAGQLEMQG